jgi:hypothetical protein
VLPYYSGYVAWRGFVRRSKLTPKLLDLFSNKFIFFFGHKTHILCYLIPGPNGELSVGRRRLNWVWYVNVPLHGSDLKKVMIDLNGVEWQFSVPQGMVNGDIVKKQKNVAEISCQIVFKSCYSQQKSHLYKHL